jgi:hypothetical protein
VFRTTDNYNVGPNVLRVNGFGMLGNRNTIFLTNQNPNGNIKFGTGGVHGAASEKMILTSGGNLGIGTTSPSTKLDVNGDIRIDSGNGGVGTLNVYGSNQSTGRVYVGQNDSYGGGIEYNGNGSPVTTGAGSDYITLWRRVNGDDQWTARNSYNDNDWEFRNDIYASIFYDTKSSSYFVNPSQTSNLNDLEVNSLGASIFYDTKNSSYFVNPSQTSNLNDLEVNSLEASIFYDTKNSLYFVNPSQTSNIKDLEVNSLEASVMYAPNTTSYFLNLQSSTNSLVVAGDIIAFSSSDKRLKKKIKNIDKPLDIISKIGGYRFEWNEKSHKETNKKDIGVIAQEIEEFLPEIVDTRDNGYKAVDYGRLSALLIEGMKEQQKNINKQENRLDDLERRLKLLEE